MTAFEFFEMLEGLELQPGTQELLLRCYQYSSPPEYWRQKAHKEIIKVNSPDDLIWFIYNNGAYISGLGRKRAKEIIKKCEEAKKRNGQNMR